MMMVKLSFHPSNDLQEYLLPLIIGVKFVNCLLRESK